MIHLNKKCVTILFSISLQDNVTRPFDSIFLHKQMLYIVGLWYYYIPVCCFWNSLYPAYLWTSPSSQHISNYLGTPTYISSAQLPTFATSVTRLGDLFDFGQVFKAFGSN